MDAATTNSNKRLVSEMDFSPRPNSINSNAVFSLPEHIPQVDSESDTLDASDPATVPSVGTISLSSSPTRVSHYRDNFTSSTKPPHLSGMPATTSDLSESLDSDLTALSSEEDTIKKISPDSDGLANLAFHVPTSPQESDDFDLYSSNQSISLGINSSHSERVELIESLINHPLVLGETWYIVSKSFYNKFCHGDSELASFFGNADIVDPVSKLLLEKQSITLVPIRVWENFVQWYSTTEVIPLPRKVVSNDGLLSVDLFPYEIVVKPFTFLSSLPHQLLVTLSKSEPPTALVSAVAQKLELPDSVTRYRFWLVDSKSELLPRISNTEITSITFNKLEKTLLDLNISSIASSDIQSDSTLIVEIKSTDGESIPWPSEQTSPLTAPFPSSPALPVRQPVRTQVQQIVSGKMGLANLGNTCYMNSALQCLVHVPELANYFLSGYYKKELNFDNPIGHGGQVARAFGDLEENVLGSSRSGTSYAPRAFKQTIGRFNSAFAGYMQQDSQEFLAFLLDGLHEDLNRILKKPATEKPELKNDSANDLKAIAELAKESWRCHKLRNESVILDLFGGLYKSTLVCPECSLTSVTFDPFMDLTLPLPSKQVWSKDIFVFPQSARPVILSVELNPAASGDDLKQYIANHTHVKPEALHIVEVFRTSFFRNLSKLGSVTEISADDDGNDVLAVYEADFSLIDSDEPFFDDEKNILVPVYFQFDSSNSSVVKPKGVPFYISLNGAEASDANTIKQKVLEKCAQMGEHAETVVNDVDLENPPFTMYYHRGNAGEAPACDWRIYTDRLKPLVEPVVEAVTDADEIVADNEGVENSIQSSEVGVSGDAEAPLEDNSEPGDTEDIVVPSEEHNGLPTPSDTHSTGLSEVSDDDQGFSNLGTMFDDDPNAPLTELGPPPPFDDSPRTGQLLDEYDTLVCTWDEEKFDEMFGEGDITESFARIIDPDLVERRREREEKAKRGIALDDCLDEFSKTEVLGEDDLWHCSRCKDFRRASKTIELWKIPDIFTVHLKRFSSYHGFRDKLDDVVNFPIEGLDMTRRIEMTKSNGSVSEAVEEDGQIYDLFAVDNHYGGLGGGHYTAYAKNFVDDKWYYFDDSRVREADPRDSVTGAAYLLFYRKRSSSPLGGEKMQEILSLVEEHRESGEELRFEPEVEAHDPFHGPGRVLGTSDTPVSMPWGQTRLTLSDTESESGKKEMGFEQELQEELGGYSPPGSDSNFSISSI